MFRGEEHRPEDIRVDEMIQKILMSLQQGPTHEITQHDFHVH
jgi:hypothetical protein